MVKDYTKTISDSYEAALVCKQQSARYVIRIYPHLLIGLVSTTMCTECVILKDVLCHQKVAVLLQTTQALDNLMTASYNK